MSAARVRVGIFAPLLWPRFLAIFVPLACLTGGVVLVLYQNDVENEHRLHEQAGEHVVKRHYDILVAELKAAESDLLYLANQAILRNYLSGKAPDTRELEDEYRLFANQRGVYDQIRYLDRNGYEKVRINYMKDGGAVAVPESALQPKADRYYFQRTMRLDRGQVFVSPLDLNVEHGEIERPFKPTVRLATPVFEQKNVRGIVILNYLGSSLLAKLAAASERMPGATFLLNKDGFFLRGPTPEDEWGFMLKHQRSFATYYPEAWQHLTRDTMGQFETSDGLFTFHTLWPDNESKHVYNPADSDTGAPTLKVVSYISTAALHSRSRQLLDRLLLLYGVALVAVLVLAWYLAHAGAVRRGHEQQLAESEARLRSLSTQLLTAHEDERRRLSRDLHDELGQVVTSVTLNLERAAQAADVPKKDEMIGRALQGTASMLDAIHEISARVRPTLLDDLGLKEAIQSLLGDYEHRTGIVPKAELHFEHQEIPALVSDNVYRILQEALTNVARHAGVQEVSVALRVSNGTLALRVHDAGSGFTPESLNGERLGVLGMRERTELLGGSFDIGSAPGQGTEIQVKIPLRSNRNERAT